MNIIERVFIEPFQNFIDNVIRFLPNFLTAVLLVIVGIVLGVVLRAIFLKFFRAVNLDRLAARSGMLEVLMRGGIRDPISMILSRLIGGFIMFVFAVVAVRTLEIPTVEMLFEKFLLYIPHLFVALLILLFGYLLSNFFGRTALIAAVNAGVGFAGLIGKFVKLFVFLLAATMAMEQLGIGRETVIIAFAIIFGGAVFAFSLAFGLGGKDLARDYLEKKIAGAEEEKDEISHL